MGIDDYQATLELQGKLQASLPFKIRLTKECCEQLNQTGHNVSPETWYFVEHIYYMGDEGGISVAIQLDTSDRRIFVSSITHVRIDPEHELAQAVIAYQQERVRRLTLQAQKGFAAELLSQVKTKKTHPKRKKGFS